MSSSQENLSSQFATRYDSNRPAQLQNLARVYKYYTIQGANSKGADQTARMRRQVCNFVVCIWHKTRFSNDVALIHQSFDNENKRIFLHILRSSFQYKSPKRTMITHLSPNMHSSFRGYSWNCKSEWPWTKVKQWHWPLVLICFHVLA